MGNPWYRYYLAREAFGREDYRSAIDHLRFAARRTPGEERFAALLGLSYLQRGDVAAAERWLSRAAELSGDDSPRSRYSGKLDRLRSAGSG